MSNPFKNCKYTQDVYQTFGALVAGVCNGYLANEYDPEFPSDAKASIKCILDLYNQMNEAKEGTDYRV